MHKHTRQQQCRSNDFSFDEYFNACGWLETSMYVRLAGALNSITRTSMHAINPTGRRIHRVRCIVSITYFMTYGCNSDPLIGCELCQLDQYSALLLNQLYLITLYQWIVLHHAATCIMEQKPSSCRHCKI